MASTAHLHFPPLMVGPRSSLREPVPAFPRPVAPPLPSSTCTQIPISPRGSPVRYFLPPPCLHTPSAHTPPFRPRPSAQSPDGPGWWCCVLCPPVPYASASPSLCSTPSLGIFWSLIPVRCPFAQKLEACAHPLSSNRSTKPLPLRYSAMTAPFRLPGSSPLPPSSSPPCRHDTILVCRGSVGVVSDEVFMCKSRSHPYIIYKDVVQPKMSPFSVRHLILVKFKVWSQLYQLIYLAFSYLKIVYEIVLALNCVVSNFIFFTVPEKINLKFFRYDFFAFFNNAHFDIYFSWEITILWLNKIISLSK